MFDPLNKLAWVALREIPGVGTVIYQRLLQWFAAPEAVFQAPYAELVKIRGISPRIAKAILDYKDWPRLDVSLERLAALGGEIYTQDDELFPPGLRQIPYPPPFIYVKGTIEHQDQRAVAMVGSRKSTYYGRKVSYRLARDLSLKGIAVISGLARGIDTAAHRAALENGGRTLAVLGCGLDVIYPPENKELYQKIPLQGALVTEFPLGTPPEARNFPRRNRIISGLALGVVVVEAGEKSGSHITAQFSLDQGREVFAVPGPIDSPNSLGPHRWIQQGAKLVQDVDDILCEIFPSGQLQPFLASPATPVSTPRSEDPLVALLGSEPQQLEELIKGSGLPAAKVMSQLTILELQGLVRELPGKCYVLAD
jgi:DNA processing protein